MSRTYVDMRWNVRTQRVFVTGINQGMVLDEEPLPDGGIEAIDALGSSTIGRVVDEVRARIAAVCTRASNTVAAEVIVNYALGQPLPMDQDTLERAELFRDLNSRSLDNPPTWMELRRMAELDAHPHALVFLAHKFGIDISSGFEPTAQLRADDEGDDLGAETDAMLGMGEAESWFREKVNA